MRQKAIPIIVTLLMVAGIAWWFSTMEQVTENTYVGLKPPARDDPFLALRRLFKASNLHLEEPAVTAAPAIKFDNLPKSGTLLMGDRRHLLMTPERVRQIVAWVEGGGHLIVEAEYPGRPDPLLAALGLARKDIAWPKPGSSTVKPAPPPASNSHDDDDGDEDEKNGKSDKKGAENQPPNILKGRRLQRLPEFTEVRLSDDGRLLKVEFGAYQNLEIKDQRTGKFDTVSDKLGLRFATGVRSAGRVSVLSNFDFLIYRGTGGIKKLEDQRTHIGKYDHAEMMLRLVRLHPTHASAPLRLVWSEDDVSLWTWLREHALLAMVSLALLIVVWLWRVIPRFGPLVPELRPAEQKIASHLEAAGRFYWKHLGPAEVYAKLSSSFMQRLGERRPGIFTRKSADRNAELARLAGVNEEAVARALDHPVHNIGELVRNAVLLQRISQKL